MTLSYIYIAEISNQVYKKQYNCIQNKKQVQLLTELNIHAILYVHVNVASIELHDQRNYGNRKVEKN